MKTLSSSKIATILLTLIAVVLGGFALATPAQAENLPAKKLAKSFGSNPVTGQAADAVVSEIDSAAALTLAFGKDLASAEALERAQTFIDSAANGNANQITGLYSAEHFAFPVTGQPSGSPGYVSNNDNEVTRFGMASEYGSRGFLAHNYLAGAEFFELSVGEVFTLVYGDGSTKDVRIESIQQYQALSPNSPYSSFIDLATGEQLSATSLFYKIYNSENYVVLQTCIEKDGLSTWGRLFVVAVPLS